MRAAAKKIPQFAAKARSRGAGVGYVLLTLFEQTRGQPKRVAALVGGVWFFRMSKAQHGGQSRVVERKQLQPDSSYGYVF